MPPPERFPNQGMAPPPGAVEAASSSESESGSEDDAPAVKRPGPRFTQGYDLGATRSATVKFSGGGSSNAGRSGAYAASAAAGSKQSNLSGTAKRRADDERKMRKLFDAADADCNSAKIAEFFH